MYFEFKLMCISDEGVRVETPGCGCCADSFDMSVISAIETVDLISLQRKVEKLLGVTRG